MSDQPEESKRPDLTDRMIDAASFSATVVIPEPVLHIDIADYISAGVSSFADLVAKDYAGNVKPYGGGVRMLVNIKLEIGLLDFVVNDPDIVTFVNEEYFNDQADPDPEG